MNNNKKSIIKKCDKIANMFLELATNFKALAKSLERTTDKNEIILIKKIINNKINLLEKYFEEAKFWVGVFMGV